MPLVTTVASKHARTSSGKAHRLGKGKGGKRHTVKQKSIGFTHAGFKRLTFRAGAKRTAQSAFLATRDLAERFVENLVFKADCLTGSRRKTIRLSDVLEALERMNQQAYV